MERGEATQNCHCCDPDVLGEAIPYGDMELCVKDCFIAALFAKTDAGKTFPRRGKI